MPDAPTVQINNPPPNNDHDLLLTIKAEMGTKLDRVIADVKDLKDDLASRVSELEGEKLGTDEFTTYKNVVAAETKTYKDSIERDRVEFKRAVDLTIDDHETRIRSNTAWIQYGLGTVAGIEVILFLYQLYKTFHP
jgi:hypothetical protein